MAVTASGLFMSTMLKVFNASQEPVALIADTVKVALFTNSITPNFSTDTAYGAAPYNANEVSGSGYSAAGLALTTKTFTELNTAYATLDGDDSAWTSSTFASARCALLHDTTVSSPTSDPALALINFGADYAVTSGTFTIQYAATGIYRIQCF